jgi:geranylgeranyl pyrophosphate synthase
MRLALTGQHTGDEGGPKPSRWAQLPGLCCQAAGGQPGFADEVTLAWLLYYSAADLMDSVQDQDEPDAWWREQGPGAALAAASGLYFSGTYILDLLNRKARTAQVAPAVVADFYQVFMTMTSAQYRDLTVQVANLQDYWQLAESKSGAFFRLACLAGARLGNSSNQVILSAYADYGLHLGLLIQVLDDLDDIRHLGGLLPAHLKGKIKGSLPFIYAYEMSSTTTQELLLASLQDADKKQSAVDDLVALLDECQSALYVMAEMENQRQSALTSLELAAPLQPHKDALVALVRDL